MSVKFILVLLFFTVHLLRAQDPAPTAPAAPPAGSAAAAPAPAPTAPVAAPATGGRTTGTATTPPTTRAKRPLRKLIYEDGGSLMYVLTAFSILAVFMTVWFALTMRVGVVMPEEFRHEAERLAAQGDVEGLHTICQGDACLTARVLSGAVRCLRDNPQADWQVLHDLLEDEGSRQAGVLWQRLQYLMDIAVVSPMVGLLGTVLGMIQAFVGLSDRLAEVRPVELSGGVSKALITTAGGLIVGIPAMIVYAYFRGRLSGLVSQVEEGCVGVLQRLVFSRARKADARPAVPPEPPAPGA